MAGCSGIGLADFGGPGKFYSASSTFWRSELCLMTGESLISICGLYGWRVVSIVLRVYNTLTRRKEEFVPLRGRRVNMFVCGQTVYDDAHLGHAKTYINFDVIVRWLRYRGYSVFYVQNVTDIDDKIIRRARERGMRWDELSSLYLERFFEDMEALGVKQNVNLFPKSSDYIPEIIEQVKGLIEKGYAYKVDGDVYYHVPKFPDYTKLSGMKLEDLGKHRIEPDPRKKSPLDFALWKSAKPGEPYWDSPWGPGRPGWHIEDTAMTITIFGPQYDLHGGATELIFPHHTNEIAQAEAYTGRKPFVKYWLHSGVLMIGGEKMSKSLKNFITVREALSKYGAEAIRLYIVQTHYRKPIDYREEDLARARDTLNGMYNTLDTFRRLEDGEGGEELASRAERLLSEFEEAMDDDFNTPLALSKLHMLLREMSRYAASHNSISREVKGKVLKTVRKMGWVFGILQRREEYGGELLEKVLDAIVEVREELRKMKQYEASDMIRSRLAKAGVIIEDTPNGPIWKIKR